MKRLLQHVPVGAVSAYLLYEMPPAGVLFTVGFFLYELNEDWSIKDQAWRDLKGWLWGCAITALVLIYVP
ncbi:MAG: hypothetical protein MUP81_04530 [Dehalococcoidia bacterium]|nr:hypothetical protein [Dehalococcoidia bacterium]